MATLVLLRHAKAIARAEWLGEDEDRPLAVLGQDQAKRMAGHFSNLNLVKIYTSDAVRCLDSVKCVADDIVVVDSFSTDKTKISYLYLNGKKIFTEKWKKQ